ncbi:unnamed protein product, partial [Rotaria socialis]
TYADRLVNLNVPKPSVPRVSPKSDDKSASTAT